MKKHSFNSTFFEVDWDSFEDVKSLLNVVKGRFNDLNPDRTSRKEKEGKILDSCFNIFNSDISDVYYGMDLSESPNYYVYCHCNPKLKMTPNRGKTAFANSIGLVHRPFYVGKGTGNRAFDLNRSETHRKIKQNLKESNLEPEVIIVKDGLTEVEALCYESKLIDIFGLIPYKGWLSNLDEGYSFEERRNKYYEDYKNLCPGAIANWDIDNECKELY